MTAAASTSGRCCTTSLAAFRNVAQVLRHGCLPRSPTRVVLANKYWTCHAAVKHRALCSPPAAQVRTKSANTAGQAGAAGQGEAQQQSLTDALGYLLFMALVACPPAMAAEGVAYNPEGGAETLKTLAGVAYIGLVIVYFFRLFSKRAKSATSQPLASTRSRASDSEEDSDDEEEVQQKAQQPEGQATPLNCFIGAAQAGVICYLLYLVTTAVDGYFADKPLPDQYTARNIAVLVQTVVRGLAYLITFIFGANCVGLTGLMLQLLFFPDSLEEAEGRKAPQKEKLPDVSITDDIFAIRRAFQEAERMGRKSVDDANK